MKAPSSFLWRTTVLCAAACILSLRPAAAIDANGNGLNDVWELIYGAQGLTAAGDADGDGFSNADESRAGTNPFAANSRPALKIASWGATQLQLGYTGVAGKRYRLESRADLTLGSWTPESTDVAPSAGDVAVVVGKPITQKFWRVVIDDVDSDGDGFLDAEERWLQFDPASAHSERTDTPDSQRIADGLAAASVVTVGVIDAQMSERWPDPGVMVLRRSGGLRPITVHVSLSGTATLNADYLTSYAGTTVTIPAGVREVPIEFTPVADANDAESTETIVCTVDSGAGYTVGAPASGTINLINETASSLPSSKAAARFLIQAAFGPDEDSPADSDDIPENVEEVMALGFNAWIDDQFTRSVGLLQPWTDWEVANGQAMAIYGNAKEHAWWNRAMGVNKLRPDSATTVTPDPLRQRLAFALSEILVAGDRPEKLAVEQRGMANFYDLMVTNAFGNFRDLLFSVATHPVMGIYLSHLGNQKADPVNNIFPDENFAREVMQLFSIGLWKLNPDGTRQLDVNNQPIPTYSNADITELARVFTGLTYGSHTGFESGPEDYTVPMKGWDDYHDCQPKSLLGGLVLPARTPTANNTGTATLADVNAAIDYLFNHQNVGPFIGKQLIQRFVTSNPSPGYVSRVSAAFANNGSGVRGDMKAVIKAILLDTEARDPAMISQAGWGKLREPFLRCVNFARAFNASAPAGYYLVDQFALAHAQDPMNSPSVFNFFLPTHSPPGPLTQNGLVAPEFQIINASTAVTGANYFWDHTLSDLHYWGTADPNRAVKLNLNTELAYLVPAAQINDNNPVGPAIDPDPFLRRLDLSLTGGTLSPRQFQIIREAMLRIQTYTYQWHRERFRLAVYLITTSPEFNVLR